MIGKVKGNQYLVFDTKINSELPSDGVPPITGLRKKS